MSDIYRIDGSLSLVTGASKGIGAAIAKALARQGSDVLLLARNMKEMEEIVTEIKAMGRYAKAFQIDLSDPAQVEKFLISESDALKNLNHFISNAAFTVQKRFTQSSLQEFDDLLSVNVRNILPLMQSAAEIMKARGSGTITFITSVNAISPLPSQAVYSSTKAMLEALMKSAASELAPYGVRVNSVVPGAIKTPMNSHVTPEQWEVTANRLLSRRVGVPEEIADVVAFMCSDAARYMYGSSVLVDGGLLLRG